MKRRYINRRLFYLLALLVFAGSRATAQSAPDTLPVYFAFNESTMNRDATGMLDSVRYEEILNPGQALLIIGYADYVGGNDYNDKLSRERAQAVKNYLLTLGFHDANVQLCIGKGEVARTDLKYSADGYPPDRRVDIVILGRKKSTKTVSAIDSHVQTDTTTRSTPEEQHFISLKKAISAYTPEETFQLENLYFPPNRHYLEHGSEKILDTLFVILKNHPRMHIRVEGHICCVTELPDAFDEDTHTYDLSVNRAKYIRAYLVQKGIPAPRIDYKGFGRQKPVEPVELTEEQARRNRRVEIRILSQ